MSNRANEDLMDSLHQALASEMLTWIKSGDLTAQQASAIVKFLKDNDITGIPLEGSPLSALQGLLPELTFDDVQRHL